MEDYQDPPYFGDLVQIRYFMQDTFDGRAIRNQTLKEFQHWKPFPQGWCALTSGLVTRVTGLEFAVGTYPQSGSHTFNHDPVRDLYIDLTEDQFDPNLPVINIHTASTLKSTVDLRIPNIEILEKVGHLSGLLYKAFL